MTTNEALVMYNFLSKVQLKSDKAELPKELKVKVMLLRIKLGKIRKEFDEDVQEAVKGFTPEGYAEIAGKKDKTAEEEQQVKDWNAKIQDEYNSFIVKRGQDEVTIEAHFTNEEYNELLEVNASNDVEINGQKIPAADFLEILYTLFVEEN